MFVCLSWRKKTSTSRAAQTPETTSRTRNTNTKINNKSNRPDAMSSRQTKKAALAALRERRAGLSAASSKLEEYTVADEGDVYDVVDEAEYEELVEKRRQREDFVVDDGEYMCLYTLRCTYTLLVLSRRVFIYFI